MKARALSEVVANHATPRQLMAWLGLSLGLVLGIYLRNPAVALLAGLAVRLSLEVNPIAASTSISKYALQTAIVLLGFTLGFDRMVAVSASYGLIVAGYVVATIALGLGLARLFDIGGRESQMLTGGTAICGGTAIATLAPLMDAKPHQVAVATALVFLLNVIAVFTFPLIGHWLELSQETFGAWVALAVHDTSSVVATAAIYGDEAAEVATTVKLGRTLWLLPVAFAVSAMYRQAEARLRVPGFLLLFVAAAVIGSLIELPPLAIEQISWLSKVLLVIALLLIGLEIRRETLKQLSVKTVAFGVGLWALVAPLALFLVTFAS